MNVLKTWAISLSSACICAAVISFLKPHEKFDKVLKLALGAFLCTALLTPFFGAEKLQIADFSPREATQESLQKEGEDFLIQAQINAAAENVKKEIETRLQQKGYSDAQVHVSMNIDAQENILINEINISGVPEQQRQAVHDMLKKELSLEVAVQ